MNEMKSLTLDGKTYDSFRDQNAVRITPQNLTPEQQAQARDNLGSSGIIDVVELPTENIRSDALYRLTKGYCMHGTYLFTDDFYTVHCVTALPETGEPITDIEQTHAVTYYNCSDGVGYGYIDDVLSAALSVPAGWYDAATLSEVMGMSYGGIITDISDARDDDVQRLLLCYDYYVYNGEWTRLIFATEKPPKIDITWDGDMTGRSVIDMTIVDPDIDLYMVKVSDEVPTIDELSAGTVAGYDYSTNGFSDIPFKELIDTGSIDDTTYPGCVAISDIIVIVHSADTLSEALGAPEGYITNGVYFGYRPDIFYISHLTSSGPRITKIDSKYLDTPGIDLEEVQSMIDSAIGNAIGGSY